MAKCWMRIWKRLAIAVVFVVYSAGSVSAATSAGSVPAATSAGSVSAATSAGSVFAATSAGSVPAATSAGNGQSEVFRSTGSLYSAFPPSDDFLFSSFAYRFSSRAPEFSFYLAGQLQQSLQKILETESASLPVVPERAVAVTHRWSYPYRSPLSESYSLTYYILQSDYMDSRNFVRDPIYNDDFLIYLEDSRDDVLIADLVECFDMLAAEHGLSDYEEVELMISFVQSFDYVTDEEWKGENVEYPKFPLETLYDRCGDCEDTCLLLEALLQEKGYGCCMLIFEDHAALGLYGTADNPGWYFTRYGRRYYYVETTAPGWYIGEVPDERRYNSAIMIFPR